MLGLLAAAAAAHADYKEDYSRGLVALKDGNYAEARQRLQKALAEQPEAAMRVRLYGQRWEPYLPQHYLGMAEYRMGNCAAALAQWNGSENQRTIGQLADLQSEQKNAAAECAKTTAVAKKADDAAEPKPAEPARPTATPAKSSDDKRTAAVPPASDNAAKNPAIEAPKQAAEPAKPAAPVADAAKLAANKSGSAPAERPVSSAESAPAAAPPDTLIAAFDKYLGGRYADVAAIDPGSYRDLRSRYHAYLLRAAARFTLAQVGGDQSLVEGARDDVRAARAANAKATPDATMFSPRFRAFFAQNR